MLLRTTGSPPKKPDREKPDQERPTWWDRLVADWQPIWRDFRDAVDGGMSLIEAIGRYLLRCAKLVEKLYYLLRRHAGRWFALAAAVGLSSPLSGGWGVAGLSDLPLGKWAPAAFLPLAALVLRATMHAVAGESRRRARRHEGERRDPGVERDLARQESKRQVAAEEIEKRGHDCALADEDFVHDIVAATYVQCVSPDDDFSLALEMLDGGRFEPVATRGRIDDELREAIRVPLSSVTETEACFASALEPLQYRGATVTFAAGPYHYVLLGLSGATIPDQVLLAISIGATQLMLKLAYGDETPAWLAEVQ